MRPGRGRRLAPVAAAVLGAAWLGGWAACQDVPRGQEMDAEAGVAADAEVVPDSEPPPPDARVVPDAGEPPQGVAYDFCDQPFFQLPIGGPTEEVGLHFGLWGGKMAYSRGPRTSIQWDLFYFDLDRCMEYKLVDSNTAVAVYIHDDEIVWSQYHQEPGDPMVEVMDLYSYDLSTWTARPLTDHPLSEWNPKTNGRYLTYERSMADGGDAPRENLLWDREQGTEIQLVEPFAQAGYYAITDRYVAWSGYTRLADSVGKDVFYYDLVTGQETRVPGSVGYFCYDVWLWGDYLTYICSEYWVESWYHLFVHHIPTGEDLHLDGAGKDTRIIGGAIHKHLVVWNTTQYMDVVDTWEVDSDVALYDLRTGVQRRLTTAESRLSGWLIFYPWIVFIRPMGNYVNEFYVGNLEALEVVDATGNLLPGEPVLDPPL